MASLRCGFTHSYKTHQDLDQRKNKRLQHTKRKDRHNKGTRLAGNFNGNHKKDTNETWKV